MAEYINRQAFKRKLIDEKGFFPAIVARALEEMPTADVVPRAEGGAECPICHGTGRIGTTDWLTKDISKKQLAKEKAEAIAEHEAYLKAEVAREIFEEIEKLLHSLETPINKYWVLLPNEIAELKKKYTEDSL